MYIHLTHAHIRTHTHTLAEERKNQAHLKAKSFGKAFDDVPASPLHAHTNTHSNTHTYIYTHILAIDKTTNELKI
jgi:hypothetical protein